MKSTRIKSAADKEASKTAKGLFFLLTRVISARIASTEATMANITFIVKKSRMELKRLVIKTVAVSISCSDEIKKTLEISAKNPTTRALDPILGWLITFHHPMPTHNETNIQRA